ncbi:MAG: diadenylate cyclase CdaA [Hydrogenobaculum sp.]
MREILHFITFKDLIDIALVYFLVYEVIYYMAKSRGGQILKGVIVIALIWILSEALGLKTMSFIFEKLWTLGIVVLVVIFQPEIRRALSRLGERTSIQKNTQATQKVIERIAMACSFLSQRQIGALIVIERSQSLEDVIDGCSYIDAAVSVELLITIFYPMTPLHDGAVVIKEDKILYASCVLPLSKNKDLPKKYGTRHRAAVGITEESDAIAVVVSEETGDISFIKAGVITKMESSDMLKEYLEKELS